MVKVRNPDTPGQTIYGHPGHRRNLQLEVTTHRLILARGYRKCLAGINNHFCRLAFFCQFLVTQDLTAIKKQASRAAIQFVTRQIGQRPGLVPHKVFPARKDVCQNTMDQNRAARSTGGTGIRSTRVPEDHVDIAGRAAQPLTHKADNGFGKVLAIIGEAKFQADPAFSCQTHPAATTVREAVAESVTLSPHRHAGTGQPTPAGGSTGGHPEW